MSSLSWSVAKLRYVLNSYLKMQINLISSHQNIEPHEKNFKCLVTEHQWHGKKTRYFSSEVWHQTVMQEVPLETLQCCHILTFKNLFAVKFQLSKSMQIATVVIPSIIISATRMALTQCMSQPLNQLRQISKNLSRLFFASQTPPFLIPWLLWL